MFDAQGVLESVATVLGFWNDPLSGCNTKADIANKKVKQITIVNQASHPGGGGEGGEGGKSESESSLPLSPSSLPSFFSWIFLPRSTIGTPGTGYLIEKN